MAKFNFETKQTHHLIAWLTVDGKRVVRTRRSNTQGDLPAYRSIRQQLHLTDKQLTEAIKCTLSRDAYLEILRSKGIM